MHYFPSLDERKVLWELSHTNLNMYLATIPTYEPPEEGEEGTGAPVLPRSGGPRKTPEDVETNKLRSFFARC